MIAFIIILVLALVAVCVCCLLLYKRKVCAKCKKSIREGIFILSFKTTNRYLIYKNDMNANYFKTNVIAWYTWKPPQTVFFFFWTVFFRFLPAKCHNQNGKFIHKKMQNSPNLKKKIKFHTFLLFLFYVYF